MLTKLILVVYPLIAIASRDILMRHIESYEDYDYVNSELSDKEARKISSRHWFCGAGRLSNHASAFIMSACFGAKYDFNHQCAIHDDCYDNQRGREKCDADFCEKNNLIAYNYIPVLCHAYTESACYVVTKYGGEAYAEAGNSHPYYEPYVMNNEFGKTYQHIFDNCKHQNATFSDCAYIYETCVNENWGKCNGNLKGCITETKDQRDPDSVCDAAVEKVAQQIAD